MKQCSKCNIIKDDIEFYQGRVCKVCHNIRVKIWQNNNKERCCENLKKWREKNKERNKERYSKTIKQYCIENAQNVKNIIFNGERIIQKNIKKQNENGKI